MQEFILNDAIIANVKTEAIYLVKELLKEDLVEMILYGSCARGDYTADSDIDIALLVKSGRNDVQRYNDGLAKIATALAIKYFAIVNFVCIPYEEYIESKNWYAYFHNIEMEGELLYG